MLKLFKRSKSIVLTKKNFDSSKIEHYVGVYKGIFDCDKDEPNNMKLETIPEKVKYLSHLCSLGIPILPSKYIMNNTDSVQTVFEMVKKILDEQSPIVLDLPNNLISANTKNALVATPRQPKKHFFLPPPMDNI